MHVSLLSRLDLNRYLDANMEINYVESFVLPLLVQSTITQIHTKKHIAIMLESWHPV